MTQAKLYRTEVRTDASEADVPLVAIFSIDESSAKDICNKAALIKANGLYKVQVFDYRTSFLKYDPETDPEEAAAEGEDNDVNTDCATLNVTDTEFWFSAYIKHVNVQISTSKQRIADLVEHFAIPPEPTTANSSAPATIPTAVVEINGGAIYAARSNVPMRIIILDEDIEGSDGERIKNVLGSEYYVHDYVLTATSENDGDGIDQHFVGDVATEVEEVQQ